jgi:hypothetical protein
MERFKQTIKRIAALAGGAVMVGATMAGALATLDSLPQPFVTSAGVFDAYIVVGTMGWNPNLAFNAAAATGLSQDLATGIDVGAAFAQRATTASSGAGPSTTVSGGTLIKAPGDDFNYGETVANIKPTGFDKTELPDVLAEGTYKETKGTNTNDVNYKQKLTFAAGTAGIVFDADDNADTQDAGTYLHLTDAGLLYTYTLDFDDTVHYDGGAGCNTDWDKTKIEIQGKTYTVTAATCAANVLDTIEMISGAVTVTQGEYTTQTYTVDGKTYEVEVLIIADNAVPNTAQFRVNGQTTDPLEEGETFELSDGVEIGIDYISPNEGSEAAGADQVTFYLGAQKLELENGNEVKINGETNNDYELNAAFTTPANGQITAITLTAQPGDEQWIHEGDNFVDPLFGAWELDYTGLEKTTEEIKGTASSNKGKFTFNNADGDKIDIPTMMNAAGNIVAFGEKLAPANVFIDQDNTAGGAPGYNASMPMFLLDDGDSCAVADGAAAITACENTEMLVVSAGGEARVFKITKLDDGADATWNTGDDSYDVKDMLTSETYDNLAFGALEDVGLTTIRLDQGSGANIVGGGGNDEWVTATTINHYGAGHSGGATGWALFTTDKDAEVDLGLFGGGPYGAFANFGDGTNGMYLGGWDYQEADADGDIEVMVAGWGPAYMPEKEDSDIQWAIDIGDQDGVLGGVQAWGALFKYDSENDNNIVLYYPEERVIADVYLAPTGATATTAASGAVNVNYINAATGIARTDQDFETPTKNVVLIGGPFVNELVSTLATAGKTQLAETYTADTAIVQLIEDAYGTYDALIIAGNEAKDTALAGKVVAARLTQNQFMTELKGNLVKISTAGASTVNDVTFV